MGVTATGARVLAVAVVLALGPVMLAAGAGAQQLPPAPPAPGSSDTSSGADAQDPAGQIQILGVVEGDDAVTLDVAVPTAFGPLAPVDSNFGVTDGGQTVDLSVAPVGAAADTMLALDTSGSMEGPALEAAKAAARTFVRTVSPDTRVGLETFGERVTIHQEPTLDRDSLLAALDGITTADGNTALWDALVTAADLVGTGPGRGSVVVLSDGDNTAGTASQPQAIEHLRSRSTILYAVAVESPDANLGALQATVDQVGGQYLPTADIGEIDSLYTEIAGRLANRYQLTFAPAQHGTRTAVVSVVGQAPPRACSTIARCIRASTAWSRTTAGSAATQTRSPPRRRIPGSGLPEPHPAKPTPPTIPDALPPLDSSSPGPHSRAVPAPNSIGPTKPRDRAQPVPARSEPAACSSPPDRSTSPPNSPPAEARNRPPTRSASSTQASSRVSQVHPRAEAASSVPMPVPVEPWTKPSTVLPGATSQPRLRPYSAKTVLA